MNSSATRPTTRPRIAARRRASKVKWRSQDLASALLLVGATLLLMTLGRTVLRFFEGLAVRQLGGRAWLQADASFVTVEWNLILFWLAKALLPIMGLIMLMAVVVHLAQVGFLFLPQKLRPTSVEWILSKVRNDSSRWQTWYAWHSASSKSPS